MSGGKTGRQRSIYASLLVPMILLVLAEIALFAGILVGSGALQRLDQDSRDILDQQVVTRRDSLQNYLVGTVGDLRELAATINTQAQSLLDVGQLDMDLIDSGSSASSELVRNATVPLIETMRGKRISGAFVVFNTHDLSAFAKDGAYGTKPGIYIRDMDPAATPSPRNEDLVIAFAASDVVQSFQITTDKGWMPTFDFESLDDGRLHDFLYLPWQTAFDAKAPAAGATDYAYWGFSSLSAVESGDRCVTYSIPLILDDGRVYGVVGVALSSDYMKSLLPSTELLRDEDASYLLAIADETDQSVEDSLVKFEPVVQSGAEGVPGIDLGSGVSLARLMPNEYIYRSSAGNYYAGCQFLRLYNTNSPFEHERWALAGLVSESTLHRFSNHVRNMILVASLLMMALGVVGSVFAARRISKPIRGLSSDVANARLSDAEMPELACTGIAEVDELTGAITTLSRDIASVKQLEQRRIEHERDYDLLTGLMNRRALYREAGKLFATPAMLKHAAMVMLDLDDLKGLNDSHGHDWGDKYIYQAARTFEEAVPDSSLVARVSGDEFFLLLYGYESDGQIRQIVDHLKEAISQAKVMLPGGQAAPLGASGGVAFYPQDSTELPELMKLADFAMYQVKVEGKGDIGYFDMSTYQAQSVVRRAVAELEALFADPEKVDYHFQPIFDLHTGSVVAYEALMRVSLESLRSPADVVTLARQERRMTDVERVTWQRSFDCFGELSKRGEVDPAAYLFINSFANVVLDFDDLAALAAQHPQIMSRAVIEITEAENMDEDATAAKRAIPGFSGFFALDDYGSGYNSEVMLLDLKPKFVKVDISIVRDIDTSIDRQRIMSNVIAYAHERDMLIIAEGVETSGELACCIKLGVDLAQGYYLATPARVPGPISAEALGQIETASAGGAPLMSSRNG